ncbi:hypothetical protein D6D11_04917 [Aureobasidium pullulans]|nr:hypothetical protein D6D11_04917 [Aureobasidium pullulans]
MNISKDPETSETLLHDGSDDNDGLPLYEDVQAALPEVLALPSPMATPDDVRIYLLRLLMEKRRLHLDRARHVASKWVRGNGQDLVEYSPQVYYGIFGHEDGWMVYKEVHLFRRQEARENLMRTSPYPAL